MSKSISNEMSFKTVFDLFPWITWDFVQSIIEKSELNKCVAIKSFNATLAFKNGECFCSNMVALTVVFVSNCSTKNEGIEKQKNFLIKVAITTEEMAKISEECHFFEREAEAYTNVLPALEKHFHSIGIFNEIAPRCYMTDTTEKMLVLEDLRANQFKIVNSMVGLDAEHLKLTLLTLARWHAGTATLLLTNPNHFHWYKKIVDYKNATKLRAFFNDVGKTISNVVKNWPAYETIATKLANIPDHIHDSMHEVYSPMKNAFNVITHGDMFLNNILFRYNQNGRPIDIRFIDFSIGKHTSPAIDLVCLLYASASSTITQCDREHLIQYYHGELVKYLKILNFPGPTPSLLEIQCAAFRVDYYNALIVLFVLGLRFVKKSYDGGFMEVFNDGENPDQSNVSKTFYSHPECIEQLKYLLNLFDRRGYFDY